MTALYPAALGRLTSPLSLNSRTAPHIVSRHLRGLAGGGLPLATPVDNDAVADHWVDYYVDRILEKKDTVTIIDGEPGEGKSNFALWLGSEGSGPPRAGRPVGTRILDLENDIVYRLTTFVHRVYQSSRQNPERDHRRRGRAGRSPRNLGAERRRADP